MVYLHGPLPVSGVHIMIEPVLTALIPVLFRCKDEISRKLSIAVERTYAFHNITEVEVEGLALNVNNATAEAWTARWQLGVDDLV